jgi:hypothetical protein
MASEVRALLGDLVVASVELVAKPRPVSRGDRRASFAAWWHLVEPWARLALTVGAAREHVPDPHDELRRELAATLGASDVLASLRETILRRFLYIGYREDGGPPRIVYGHLDWEPVCVLRSAFEVIRDLVGDRDVLLDQLDVSAIDRQLARWGHALFAAVASPDRLPPYHWWWSRSTPPGEGTLRANPRMRSWLGVGRVPPAFWRRCHAGFEHGSEGCLVEDFLDGRRADAPTALACVYHLASELRRARIPASRIMLSRPIDGAWVLSFVPASTNTLFDLESVRGEGMLTLDTEDA